MSPTSISVCSERAGTRLDLFLTEQLKDLSRGKIQNLLKSADILLNDKPAKAKVSLKAGDIIRINIPAETEQQPQLYAKDLNLDILYQDEDIIVINKPSGLIVHPGVGTDDNTLVHALLHATDSQLTGGEEQQPDRPGIVHRLDKDTSGCIIASKTTQAYNHLVEQFKSRTTTRKIYLAVTEKTPSQPSGTIDTQMGRHPVDRVKMAVLSEGSKQAITDYQVLHHCEAGEQANSSLIRCHLHTGRTHQIRVHLKQLGCPILGDIIYAKTKKQKPQVPRLMLHAWQLSIQHPRTGEQLYFTAPIPECFEPWTKQVEQIDNLN